MGVWRRGGVFTMALAVLAVAASLGAASALGHPRPHDRRGDSPAFIISSVVYAVASGSFPAVTCSGPGALLYPGLTRCLIFTVQNLRRHPITVTQITAALDAAYPSPPPECAGGYLQLPVFTGTLVVPAMSAASTPGEPLTLKDSGTNQDACENFLYHFTYSGTASAPARTDLDLAVTPNPAGLGTVVTLAARVTGGAHDASATPQGSIAFYLCSDLSCTSTTEISSVTVDATGSASSLVSTLPAGDDHLLAVFTPSLGTWAAAQSTTVVDVDGSVADHDHDHGDRDDSGSRTHSRDHSRRPHPGSLVSRCDPPSGPTFGAGR